MPPKSEPPSIFFLPKNDLLIALAAEDANLRFIGGFLDDTRLILFRANLKTLVVPISWFREGSVKPDFTRLGIIDWGYAVKLGEFEVPYDAILYDFDPAFRKQEDEILAQGQLWPG